MLPEHGSGNFQREGKDFPGTGNLARDKHAGVTAHVPFFEISVSFLGKSIRSRAEGTTYQAASQIDCDGKNIRPFFCALLKYKQVSLADLVCQSSHMYH